MNHAFIPLYLQQTLTPSTCMENPMPFRLTTLVSLLIGSLFLLDANMTDLWTSVPMVIGATASVGVVFLVIGRLLLKSFRISPRSFQSTIVGQQAEVRAAIAPEVPGKVFLNGELWNATADKAIAPGERVTVEAAEGLMLRVATTSTAKADAALPEG